MKIVRIEHIKQVKITIKTGSEYVSLLLLITGPNNTILANKKQQQIDVILLPINPIILLVNNIWHNNDNTPDIPIIKPILNGINKNPPDDLLATNQSGINVIIIDIKSLINPWFISNNATFLSLNKSK